jgi:hypothetical protein
MAGDAMAAKVLSLTFEIRLIESAYLRQGL